MSTSDNSSALARFQEHVDAAIEAVEAKHVEAKQKQKQSPRTDRVDTWEDLLKNIELTPDARHNIVQAVDAAGNTEWRVRSCYLLAKVIGIAPERINAVLHQPRLGTVMRKLGWSGPKTMKFGAERAKGYFRAAEEVAP